MSLAPADLEIAAIAIANQLVLVSGDDGTLPEFRSCPLKIGSQRANPGSGSARADNNELCRL